MSNTIGQITSLPASTTPPASKSTLGATDFLQLLTTQLRNQNPLSPMDSTQSVAQLAQFSALQASTSLASAFSAFQSNFAVMQSSSLIGKTVSAQTTDASGASQTVTGTVKTVSVINGAPVFSLVDKSGNFLTDSSGAPLQLPTASILSIG
jgi:flagellar basal-body rod modification protein FlgD